MHDAIGEGAGSAVRPQSAPGCRAESDAKMALLHK